MTIHHANGTPKTAKEGDGAMRCDVAGPLCFSGDLMANERMLPDAKAGIHILLFAA